MRFETKLSGAHLPFFADGLWFNCPDDVGFICFPLLPWFCEYCLFVPDVPLFAFCWFVLLSAGLIIFAIVLSFSKTIQPINDKV